MFLTSLLRTALTRSFEPFVFNGVSDAQSTQPLFYENEKELGLYVHIPFCKTLCSFCPYCKVLYDEKIAQEYLNALLQEIDIIGKELKDTEKKTVTSLYFGGGSPGLMAPSLGLIINRIKKYFTITQGIGIELHPTDVNPATLQILKTAGFTMVSIGIQSFDEKCLSALGRKAVNNDEIFKSIKEAQFDTVDVDLIFAIPGQTIESLKKDIDAAFLYGATQISTYPFIDFTYATNKKKPLKESYKKKLLFGINEHCAQKELQRTSVWTFAKKNTQKYSSITRDSFLGFGVSATSLLTHQFKLNTFSIPDYIERVKNGLLPSSLRVDFSVRQRAVYYLFWSAYGMHIDAIKFERFFGIPLQKMYGFEMKLSKLLGLVTCRTIKDEQDKTQQLYELTNKGAYYFHFIEQQYTTSYIDTMWSISRTQNWPKKIVLR